MAISSAPVSGIARSAVLTQSSDVVAAPLGDETAMMDVDTGTYFVLDDVASVVWGELATPVAVEALLARLQEHYSVSAGACAEDVLPFLATLVDKGLVRRVR